MKKSKVIPAFIVSCLLLILSPASVSARKTAIYFFWGSGCPHCAQEKIFLDLLKKKYPEIEIKDFEVWHSIENAELFARMTNAVGIRAASVPVTFVGSRVFAGFSGYRSIEIEDEIKACVKYGCADPAEILSSKPGEKEGTTITLPVFGKVDTGKVSLPFFTVIIAGLDSFNPCAFFVLFFLLSLLIHARSRKRMLLIGGVFVFFSGFIYFLFMAAWLNLFLLAGRLAVITAIAAVIALIVSSINIKDFFFFKKGISLTIPEDAKPRLFERMRGLLKSTSTLSMISGAIVLAAAANTYELLCTAGFPMVFTRVLTLHSLKTLQYYIYLVLYNFVYVIPLSAIVLIFVVTLGARKLTEWEGRKLKLISGVMMLGLGVILMVKPDLLNNVFAAAGLLAAALAISGVIIFLTKKLNPGTVNL